MCRHGLAVEVRAGSLQLNGGKQDVMSEFLTYRETGAPTRYESFGQVTSDSALEPDAYCQPFAGSSPSADARYVRLVRCRFSSFLSPGTSLTWAPVRLLTGLSAEFLIDLAFSSATRRGGHGELPYGWPSGANLAVTQRNHL